MAHSENSVKKDFFELVELEAAHQRGHPQLSTLRAYRDSQLGQEEAIALQAHLVYCKLCTRALLNLGTTSQKEPPL